MNSFLRIRLPAMIRRMLGVAFCIAAQAGMADPVDISNVPPATLTASSVKPNLMFILDDSGSMGSDFLPDDVGNDDYKLCFGYAGHNRVFYNPAITYTVPRTGSGGDYAAAVFTSAKTNGFASSSQVNLSNPYSLDHAYRISAETVDSCSQTSSSCVDSETPTTGGQFKKVTIGSCRRGTCTRTTATYQYFYYAKLNSGQTDDCTDAHYTAVTDASTWTAAEKQNYANWYQYYRNRMLMMKSATGRVFDKIDITRFRVGFSTISNTGVADGSEFLNIADFNSTDSSGNLQKTKFFSKLYAQNPGGSTPLRPALQKAGQYFAKKVANQTVDPMQYSCQRNYTLLSTDGYWNTGLEPSGFIPKQLDGYTAIGNQDGAAARPQLDVKQASNSLADIAKYYHDTDIRSVSLNNCQGSVANQDVCKNKTSSAGETLAFQNMTTYTLGLGVPGVLNYQTDYDTASSGDFKDIVNGVKDWPDPLSSTSGGYANTSNTVTARIDDLWHAAVNGGGRYYSAADPDRLVLDLTDALEKIDAEAASSAGAATTTLTPVVGDDSWVFLPKYETKTWVGDIARYKLLLDGDGNVLGVSTTPTWSAAKQLAAQQSRSIYFFDATATNKLKDFTYSNLTSTQKTYFDNLCASSGAKLSQCGSLTTNALSRVTGANVVDYLRGSRQYEMSQGAKDDQVFRTRADSKGSWTPLGDIINSSPVYVRVPPFSYEDTGYAAFKSAQASRQGVVYAGANDGMLHAFNADTGVEMWAYVPTAVMSNMYQLADVRYSTNHRYFVDGTTVLGDVYDGSNWHTILVGGFNAGGRGYYALDVTDPAHPKALWEFTDTHMGLSFGRPVIAKNKAGTWFVAFTSGYNNVTGGGDGNGRLYVLNALTGATIDTIATFVATNVKAGSTTTPSNLGQINAWVEKPTDNTALRIYGGDMLGNMWRFDFDDRVGAAGKEAFLLGIAKGPAGLLQPITTPPLLSRIESPSKADIVAVSFATGLYLGQNDLGNTDVQSLYTVKDSLGTTMLGDTTRGVRGDVGIVQQSMNASRLVPSLTPVNWDTNTGWYIDFNQTAGERVVIEPDLQLGLITLATTIPTPTPCSPGGTSWVYYFEVGTGSSLAPFKSEVMLVGVINVLQNAGKVNQKMVTIRTGSDQSTGTGNTPPCTDPSKCGGGSGGGTGAARRTSWRELVN